MLYFLVFFVIIFIFLITQNKNSRSSKYMAIIMGAYTLSIFAMLFYLSKDSFYYNVVNNYFSLPKSMWKLLMFTTVDRQLLIGILNLSTLTVIYTSLHFALSFCNESYPNLYRPIKVTTLIIMIAEFIIYDPKVYEILYLTLFPDYLSTQQIDFYTNLIHRITTFINCSILIASIGILIYIYIKAPRIRLIRLNLISVISSYTLIILSYLFMMRLYPSFLIKISKYSNIISYRSLYLDDNTVMYTLFPYYLMITFLAIAYSLYRITSIHKRMAAKDFTISKQIDAADTTSKIFCHYIKNELLAIQSELEIITETTDSKNECQNVIKRCENLYQRLDSIHRSTKTSELKLSEVKITEIIQEVLSNLSYELEEFHVVVSIPERNPWIFADREYFGQALHNIIYNAVDAMDTLPKERKNITITVKPMDNWMTLTIEDTGVGISKNNLSKLFTPFFSSQPISKRWGIGLALTYKIITAHEGKIEIDSKQNIGTSVKIMLPNVRKIMT